MNNRPSTDLDAFETSLLAELTAVVRQQAAAARLAPSAQPVPARRRLRATWWAPLAGAVAATIAVALLITFVRPTPAYAVSGRNGQEITVTITRLEGAEGLQDALRQRGIRSDITYLPAGTACQGGRYAELDTPGLTLSTGADDFRITIPAGTVGRDETFVLSAAVRPLDHGVWVIAEFGVTAGPIAPCVAVDAP